MEQTVAQVYVEKAVYAIDRPYSYAVLGEMRDTLCRGCRVLVPFGGGNRRVQGIVSAVETVEMQEGRSLKPVLAQLDKTPLLTDEMFGLIGYLTAHTYCTCYEAVKAMLPNGMNVSVSERFVQTRRYTGEECAALPAGAGTCTALFADGKNGERTARIFEYPAACGKVRAGSARF